MSMFSRLKCYMDLHALSAHYHECDTDNEIEKQIQGPCNKLLFFRKTLLNVIDHFNPLGITKPGNLLESYFN